MEIQKNVTLMEDTNESESLFDHEVRLRPKVESVSIASIEHSWSNRGQSDLPIGVVIPTLDAVGWSNGYRSVDVRPRLVDKSTNQARLIDSGAQISATVRLPGDVKDDAVRVMAVNGSKIQTYGTRDIEFKIGRKTYKIAALICDVAQDILGSDFLHKYKLSLEWDDWDQSELFLNAQFLPIRDRNLIHRVNYRI